MAKQKNPSDVASFRGAKKAYREKPKPKPAPKPAPKPTGNNIKTVPLGRGATQKIRTVPVTTQYGYSTQRTQTWNPQKNKWVTSQREDPYPDWWRKGYRIKDGKIEYAPGVTKDPTTGKIIKPEWWSRGYTADREGKVTLAPNYRVNELGQVSLESGLRRDPKTKQLAAATGYKILPGGDVSLLPQYELVNNKARLKSGYELVKGKPQLKTGYKLVDGTPTLRAEYKLSGKNPVLKSGYVLQSGKPTLQTGYTLQGGNPVLQKGYSLQDGKPIVTPPAPPVFTQSKEYLDNLAAANKAQAAAIKTFKPSAPTPVVQATPTATTAAMPMTKAPEGEIENIAQTQMQNQQQGGTQALMNAPFKPLNLQGLKFGGS
jgi:hypothetical protein